MNVNYIFDFSNILKNVLYLYKFFKVFINNISP